MKLNFLYLQSWKNPSFKSTNNIILSLLAIIFLVVIPFYIFKLSPFLLQPLKIDVNVSIYQENKSGLRPKSHAVGTNSSTKEKLGKKCNMFKGNWVYFPEGPYYTNETKCVMDNRQNCMKFGRPDTDYLKWRWRPDECELPLFDATQFLELVRGKSMAFIGDSLARNHMQSLNCLLTSASRPLDISYVIEVSERWFYPDYNFTLAHLWSTHLISTQGVDVYTIIPTNLTLDVADQTWASNIDDFDYVIISAGPWFFRPLTYYEKGKYVGCNQCLKDVETDAKMPYAFRMAYKTTFRTLLDSKKFKGTTFLRTITKPHVKHNERGVEEGNCAMTRPYGKHENELGDLTREMLNIQMEELDIAKNEGEKRGLKFRLLNVTEAMSMRPDGHPNTYGHWQHEKLKRPDCLHWCLPGPVDLWNEILLEMIKMESK